MNAKRNISSEPKRANRASAIAASFFMFNVAKSNRLRIIKKEAETMKQNTAGSL